MRKIAVTCACCKTEHQLTVKEVALAFSKLRKVKSTPEHMKRISRLGVEARKNKHEPTE